MNNITPSNTLYLCLLTATLMQICTAQEKNDVLLDTEIQELYAQDAEEKHASFHIEEIIISNDNNDYYDQDREKHIQPPIKISTDFSQEESGSIDDEFLDTFADDLATETPHAPRHNHSVLEKVVIAVKIVKNITTDFFSEKVRPVLSLLWRTTCKTLSL